MKYCINFMMAFSAVILSFTSFSQITVDGSLTAQQLAEILAGPNITVTNATLTGSASASASFAGSTDIGFPTGVILSSGDINDASGPNGSTGPGGDLGTAGTAQMTALAGVATQDAITLEFDFEVQSALIQFNYVFASEEYPEYAPPNSSAYNDVFAFYISGPGITGEENIALVPNSTDAVAINNINPITNNQYYIDNAGGQDIEFDGYTTILEAKRNNLTPCEVYHLKLVIADAGDGVYSSAVFLQENSLIQGTVNVETQTVNADDVALEGCIPASFTFAYDEISNQDRIINFTVGGTAVNGVDYQFVDSSMTIVAGDTSATIYIDAFSDGITEGQESVWIIYQPAACAEFDTAFLAIDDAQPIDFTLDEFNLGCFDDNSGEIFVNASGGFPPYTFNVTDPNNVESETMNNPITGLSAGTYVVQVTDSYGCQADALVVGGVYDADTTFLPDVPNGQVLTYDAPLPITGFNPGQIIEDVSQIQQICLTMEHSYLGDLKIEVESPSGQIVVLKPQNGGESCDLGEPFASDQVDGANSDLTDPGIGYEYCFNASPIYGTMVGESNNFTHTIPASTGGTYTDNYLPSGSYTPDEDFSAFVGSDMNGTWTVHVTDQFGLDNGYIFNWYISLIGDKPDTLVTLLEPEEIVVSGFVTNATCGGSDGAINIDITGAAEPSTVLWSNGAVTEDLSSLPAGTYSATVTDANGCQSTETFLVNNIGALDLTYVVQGTSCFGGSDGSIDVTPSGGVSYTYTWASGETTEDISSLSAGTYTVSIADEGGCVISEEIVVDDATQIVINSTSILNEECNTDNGSISIDVVGGTGSYGYQWSNGEGTQNISNLTGDSYTIDVVDGNGCAANETFAIVNDVSNCSAFCFIEVMATTVSDENCGSNDGAIDVTILNAVAPLSYSWSNGELTEDLTGLSEGSYTLVVTDANNCSEVMTFQIANNTGNMTIVNTVIGEENCGNSNGNVDVSIIGGALPYSFSWSNGETTEDISGVVAGTYSVIVTDGNGCQIQEAFEVVNNASGLVVTSSVNDEACTSSTGSIFQTVTGGNGVLTYTWNTGQTTEDISGLSAGTYIATVTDETGCYIENTYEVGQTTGDVSVIGSNITHEVCGNSQGEINITVTGNNLSYLWSNGDVTEDISGLSAGNYSCTITNLQGCNATTEVYSVINASGTLGLTTQLVTDEICGNANGSINMNIAGGSEPYSFSWSNGSIDEDLQNLSAGIYSLTVTDANGCTETRSVEVELNQGTLQIQNAIVTNENCGDGTGDIDVIVIGGAPALTYSWSNGETTEDISSLNAGNYAITITDQNGCEATESYEIDNVANTMAYSVVVQNEVCSNGQGELALNVTGGTAPYSYLWSNAAAVNPITGLTSGVYSCTITDDTGCSIVTEEFTIGNTPNGITVQSNVTDAICSNNGAIDLNVNGGAAPLTFLWSNAEIIEDISNLASGTYNYTVTDASGCEVNGSAEVMQTNGDLDFTFTSSNETCSNGLGEIILSVTGGTNTYTYLWSNGETTQNISTLSSGVYTCVVSDANGCSIATTSIQVSNNSGDLSISNLIATDETCSNGLGNIDISITGGMPTITYLWSNGETTQDISNLVSGNYSVVVTDGNGCEASTQGVINSSAGSMSIVQPVVTNENCSNGQGAIDITILNGGNPISYLWSNGEVTEDISGLNAGTYSVTVIDANGCVSIGSYDVENNGTSLMIASSTVSDEFCGSGSGSVTVGVSGGSMPYNYSWSNGSSVGTIDNLSEGTYNLTVTDGGGCQVSGSYNVSNNAGDLVVTGISQDENCGDATGLIDISTVGGTLPLTYAWDSGESTEDLMGLSEGDYEILITDLYGCTASISSTVNNITGGLSVTIGAVTDENCGQNDGAIDATLSGTGIVSTIWSSGETTEDITGLSAGGYTLTVTNDVGCVASASTIVDNVTGGLAITFSNVGDENCMNGQGFVDIEVTGTNPITYVWDNGQVTQDAIGLSQGTHIVTITDGLGCTLMESFTVNNVNVSNISTSSIITEAFCSSGNGAIDLTVNGGISPFDFNWDSGDITEDISNLAPGDYEVTVTDDVNCTVTETITVGSQSSGLGFTNLDITDEFCGQGDGEIVFFTGGTADDYYLDGLNLGGFTASNLTAGTYTVSISDNFGCTADSIITVGTGTFFNVADVSLNETCGSSDGSIDITVTAGGPGGGTFTYLWSNGETTEDVSNLSAGTYTVTITSDGGFVCSGDYTFVIDNDATFEITESITADYCGQNIGAIDQTVVSGSGLTYLWSTGDLTEDVTGLSAGTYTCEVTDPSVGGCVTTYSYEVTTSSNGMVLSGITMDETCGTSNGSIDISVNGGSGNFSFTWDNTELTEDITGLVTGDYMVTVVDNDDNCIIEGTFTVGSSETIFDGSGVVTNSPCATCTDGEIDVTINGISNATYLWSNAEVTEDVNGLIPGTYSVVVSSPEGCDTTMIFDVLSSASLSESDIDGFEMLIMPNPAADFFTVNYVIPNEGDAELMITNTLGQMIQTWNIKGTDQLNVNSNSYQAGVYYVTIKSESSILMERLVIR